MTKTRPSRRVVVGILDVSDSDHLDAMLDTAARLGRGRHASITLLHALPQPDGWQPPQTAARIEIDQAARKQLTDAAERLASRSGYRGRLHVATSALPPVEALVAASQHADLLLLFRRKLSCPRRLVRGFITSAVAFRSFCPVMVAPEHQADGLGYVLVAVVDGAVSRSALAFGFQEASWRRVPLVAVHAWQHGRPRTRWTPSGRFGTVGATFEQGDKLLNEALTGFAEQYPDVAVRKQLVPGTLLDNVLPLTRYAQIAVAAGTWRTGAAGSSGRLEVSQLLRRAECPTVITLAIASSRSASRRVKTVAWP